MCSPHLWFIISFYCWCLSEWMCMHIHVCVCAHVCHRYVCRCVHMCWGLWPKCVSFNYSSLIFWDRIFHWPWDSAILELISKEPPAPPALVFTALLLWLCCCFFYVGSGGSNSGPHTCETGTLLTETSSTPPTIAFWRGVLIFDWVQFICLLFNATP